MFDKSYYLEPDSASPKAYVLLRRDPGRRRTVWPSCSSRCAQKTRLGALRVRDEVLMLQSLLWDDEVREASFAALEESVRISAQELEMSAALVDSFAADFEPDQFTDEYQQQLRQLIEAKLDKGESLDTEETFGAPAEAGEGEVIDLMEALKRSIEKKRGGGGGSAEAPVRASGSAAKTAPGRGARTTASKSTGTRSTATKSTGTKSTPTKTASTGTGSAKTAASKTTAAAKTTAASKATDAKSARKGA